MARLSSTGPAQDCTVRGRTDRMTTRLGGGRLLPAPKKARIALTVPAVVLVAGAVVFRIGLHGTFADPHPGLDGWLCDGPGR